MRLRAACALLPGLLFACGMPVTMGDAGTDAAPPTYAQVQTIFTQSCAIGGSSCHSSSGLRGGLDLSAGNSYAQLVGVDSVAINMKRITAGNPDQSFLWHKIANTFSSLAQCRGADCGAAMPMVAGSMLSADQLALIRAWIVAGARGP